MILLCGIPSEPPLAAVVERLEEGAIPFVMLNQRAFQACRIQWSVAGGRIAGVLSVGMDEYPLHRFTGVYLRLMDDQLLPELEDEPPSSPLRQASRQFHQALVGWADVAQTRVVNRTPAMGSNGSKPYQAQIIRRHGFTIPTTLVTNSPEEVQTFVRQHGRVVYKSISGIRSIVTELMEVDFERLTSLHACPVQFQAHVEGFDVRVHTIGDAVFATRIDSPGTDYRYADHGKDGTHLSSFELPRDVSLRCLELARDLGLASAGVDLRFTPGGDVVCFEVNPSPAYTYYEAHTGQPISTALARYLAG